MKKENTFRSKEQDKALEMEIRDLPKERVQNNRSKNAHQDQENNA